MFSLAAPYKEAPGICQRTKATDKLGNLNLKIQRFPLHRTVVFVLADTCSEVLSTAKPFMLLA